MSQDKAQSEPREWRERIEELEHHVETLIHRVDDLVSRTTGEQGAVEGEGVRYTLSCDECGYVWESPDGFEGRCPNCLVSRRFKWSSAQPAPEPSNEQQPGAPSVPPSCNAEHERNGRIYRCDWSPGHVGNHGARDGHNAHGWVLWPNEPEPQQEQPKPIGYVIAERLPDGRWVTASQFYETPPIIPDSMSYRVVPLYASPPPAALPQKALDFGGAA